MTAEDDALIRSAIGQRRLITFFLHGRSRVAEPHDYGIRDGVPQLLVYQVGGESRSGNLPNWRWVVLSHASGFALLDETFPGGRMAPTGKHSPWQRLFLRVEGSAAR
jgi:hypothetical protein